MDKKNTAIGISLFVAAFGLFLYQSNQQAKREAAYAKTRPAPGAQPASAVTPAAKPVSSGTVIAPVVETPGAPARIVTLENAVLRVAVTTNGGALKTVALAQHAAQIGKDAKTDPVLFNEYGPVPALALSFPDAAGKPVAWQASFTVKEQSPTRVVLEAKRADGLVVTREYALTDEKGRDPHLIRAVTTFRRDGGKSAPVITALNLGTLPPSEGDIRNQFLNVSAFDGAAYDKVGVDKFTAAAGFLGFGAHGAFADYTHATNAEPFGHPFHWVASANQFFTGIATFDEKSRDFTTGFYVSPVILPEDKFPAHKPGEPQKTVTGDALLNLGELAPGDSKTVALDYYVGPKEYARLAALGDNQDKVVQFMKLFGFISVEWLCKILMTSLTGLHWFFAWVVPSNPWNWGIAIVMLTVIVKGATWPLTGLQLKASENMKKLQKPMAALKEKYKDNPQKLQQETMGLYKEHRVNPLAGCLPVLIQIPIFTGLYYAFQSCAELRHQPFLWFPDLSVADTIPHLPPYIHVLPILMGLTSLVNIRMTPMAPSTDANQKYMMYGMIVFFPVICYGMPAGLTTYYTISNLLTLVQSSLIRRKAAAKTAAAGEIEVIAPVSKKSKNGKKKKA